MGYHRSIGTIAAMGLACIFGVALLTSLMAGAGVYRRVADRVSKSAEERVGLTYVAAKLHAYDADGSVRTGAFGDGDALYLSEDTEGAPVETVLYVYDGWLREAMYDAGVTPAPGSGQAVSEAASLTVSEPAKGLLRVGLTGTDGMTRTADISLRSSE